MSDEMVKLQANNKIYGLEGFFTVLIFNTLQYVSLNRTL